MLAAKVVMWKCKAGQESKSNLRTCEIYLKALECRVFDSPGANRNTPTATAEEAKPSVDDETEASRLHQHLQVIN